ncbi:MAG: hypothetical protein V7707_17010 [Motiliproteus sp.]
MKRSAAKLLALVGVVLLAAAEVRADDSNVTIRLGGFFSQVDSSIGAEAPGMGLQKRVDLESDLSLETSYNTPMFELHYQWSENHSLIFNWVQLRRSGLKQAITEPFELEFGDEKLSVQAGAELLTSIKLDLFQLAYGYDFYRTPEFIGTVTVGVHIFYEQAEFSGRIGAANEGHWSTLDFDTVSAEFAAPMPDLGVQLRWNLTPGLQLGGRLQGFALEYDRFKGHILDLRFEMVQSINDRFALGVGYQFYNMEVDYRYDLTSQRSAVLDFDGQFQGPVMFLQYQF